MWQHYILIDPLAIRKRFYPRLSAGILYDLNVKPDYNTVTTLRPTHTDIDLFEPATQESARHLRVLIHPISRIEICVDVKHHQYVSVGQLLSMIYTKLREPIPYTDMHRLSRRDYRLVEGQFHKRVNSSSRRYRDHEFARGPRYIDLFLGQTTFCGLEPSWKGKDVFELVIPKPA